MGVSISAQRRSAISAGAAVTVLRSVVAGRPVLGGEIESQVALEDDQEVPPNDWGASGSAVLRWDGENRICWELTIQDVPEGDEVIAAHVHEAPAGENGPVVFPFEPPPVDGHSEDCFEFDDSVLTAVFDDPASYYVNIHSREYRDGIVRGQLGVMPDSATEAGARGVVRSPALPSLPLAPVALAAIAVIALLDRRRDARGDPPRR